MVLQLPLRKQQKVQNAANAESTLRKTANSVRNVGQKLNCRLRKMKLSAQIATHELQKENSAANAVRHLLKSVRPAKQNYRQA